MSYAVYLDIIFFTPLKNALKNPDMFTTEIRRDPDNKGATVCRVIIGGDSGYKVAFFSAHFARSQPPPSSPQIAEDVNMTTASFEKLIGQMKPMEVTNLNPLLPLGDGLFVNPFSPSDGSMPTLSCASMNTTINQPDATVATGIGGGTIRKRKMRAHRKKTHIKKKTTKKHRKHNHSKKIRKI